MNHFQIKNTFSLIKESKKFRKLAIDEGSYSDLYIEDLLIDLDNAIDIIEQILPLALKYDKFKKEICDKDFYQKLCAQNIEINKKLINKINLIRGEINGQEPNLALVKINAILKKK